MSNRISLNREEVDRMILLGMDADRYQTQVIPDLQMRVAELTRALRDVLAVVGHARPSADFAGQLGGALARGQTVLDATSPPTNGGRL